MPSSTIEYLKTIRIHRRFFLTFLHDYNRYINCSASKGFTDSTKLAGKIVVDYHAIEKGLTMPEVRLGFGKQKVISLIRNCEEYIARYGKDNIQLLHAVGVILEYRDLHIQDGYDLAPEILTATERILGAFPEVMVASQKSTTHDDYFKQSKSDFYSFSNSRSSVRNFDSRKEVPLEKILEALDLAKNTPSVCNRQSWRSYILTDMDKIEKILKIQGGNRGFGHLADKLIIITAELGVFAGVPERNQAFVDGGMYLMNALYALHYYRIAACPLNCCADLIKENKYREICHTKSSEVYISMIACGIPAEHFKIPASKRNELDATNTVINN